jgi:hypothetical protein
MINYEVALTTTDNPYDPIDDYDDWYTYDTNVLKYCTDSYLARIAKVSSEMSDENYLAEVDRAIDEILKYDLLGIYKKVTKEYKVA